jgi:UDP-2,4-diacetamido-2,4,6-trideoxy-beta-L-altropyranose hydrolase
MRCITLADQLKKRNSLVTFICRELDGNMCDYIEARGHSVNRLQYVRNEVIDFKRSNELYHSHWLEEAYETEVQQTISIMENDEYRVDWLIVDHYALDIVWERSMRAYTNKIMVIDDLADRYHDCDIILDQNYYNNYKERYNSLIPKNCIKFLGPDYALLRDEFINSRQNILINSDKRLFIFFGGADPTNETKKALDAIQILNRDDLIIHVVVGQANPAKEQIQQICNQYSYIQYHYQINNMAEIMAKASFAVCASGSTTWERYCLGLPGILIAVAQNQIEIAEAISDKGIDTYLGRSEEVTALDIAYACNHRLENMHELTKLKMKAMDLIDGLGVYRVVDSLH